MQILVTGVTVFIGLPLIHRLVGYIHSILALSISPLIGNPLQILKKVLKKHGYG